MSSLAGQLKALRTNNETILDKKKRSKVHGVSLIYEAQIAIQQDFETIYAASLEALKELELLDPRFTTFENSLFAESSLSIDRQIQVCLSEYQW
jgi:U3 small nucleolar RNA-associated protein 10